MLMQSWPAYESYTGPLGLQTLTDITGSHYGPNIESSENNGWGQWHRADHEGVGMDRTVATGTGFVGQYSPEVAKIYESAATTPDDLLLFFHHVPYTCKLHDGKTVIQYIYDSHYDGAAQAAQFVDDWTSLKGRIDPALYADVLAAPSIPGRPRHRLARRHHAVLPQTQRHPRRQAAAPVTIPTASKPKTQASPATRVIDVNPWEDASRRQGRLLRCGRTCTAEWTYNGAPAASTLPSNTSTFRAEQRKFTLTINGQPASQMPPGPPMPLCPTPRPHGDNSTRHIIHNVALKPGDAIRIVGNARRSRSCGPRLH